MDVFSTSHEVQLRAKARLELSLHPVPQKLSSLLRSLLQELIDIQGSFSGNLNPHKKDQPRFTLTIKLHRR